MKKNKEICCSYHKFFQSKLNKLFSISSLERIEHPTVPFKYFTATLYLSLNEMRPTKQKAAMSGAKHKVKPKLQFNVSRKKLCRALQNLQTLPIVSPQNEQNIPRLHGTIIKQLNTAYVQPIAWKQKWLEMFKTSITQHDWDIFIKTLRLASQNHKFCGLDNVLRNSFFGMLTHPTYNDQKTLRLLLYTITPCRNDHDIEFCIETILRVFNSGQSNN